MHRYPDLPKAFAELGLELPVLRAAHAMGYKEPSPIQRELVPLILAGKDVMGQARTGTGKTAAFGMPVLQKVYPQGRMQALVLTPTRELAAQVVGEFRRLGEFLEVHCVPVYGGTAIRQQLHQLGKRPHVAVGTPGRVMDMMRRGALSLDTLRFAILDEVDRMLDIGFRDDIQKILGSVRQEHQTILVSATINDEIRRLALRYQKDPVEINVSRDELTVEEVTQHYCTVDPWDKFRLLSMLLAAEKPKLAIVFCNTKHSARKVAKRLHAAGIEAREIHGDLVQEKRDKVMDRFRKHKIPVLVATDLASRGIDVNSITHIINYDSPQDIEAYVHRIGRTARMGATGKAITFVGRDQGQELSEIEKLINKQISQLQVEGFEPSPPPRDEATPAAASAWPFPGVEVPVQAAAAPAPEAPARTLAGKFPLPRRRRRR
jgi:ATP-dependent RNA helicase DeaD